MADPVDPRTSPVTPDSLPATDEEQLIDVTSDMWELHKGKIIALAVVVMGVALGIAWWQAAKASQRAAASAEFSQAKTPEDYEAFARKFSSSPLAGDALILASDALANESKFDEARTLLTDMIAKYPQHSFVGGAAFARAMIAERKGDIETAISELRGVVTDFPKSYAAPIASLNLARALAAQSKTAESNALLQRFGATHVGSLFIPEAEMELAFRAAAGKPALPQPVQVIQQGPAAPSVGLEQPASGLGQQPSGSSSLLLAPQSPAETGSFSLAPQ
jgi:predicted negative regulator of RcsB-dependent stress response